MLKFTVEVTRANPVQNNEGTIIEYDVAFTIVEEGGSNFYTPTTVYPYQLNEDNLDEAIKHALKVMLPVQVGRMLNKAQAQPTNYFDTLAESL